MGNEQIELGQLYAEADDKNAVWRIDAELADGIHVRLARVDQSRRFKTFSISALADRRIFVRVPS